MARAAAATGSIICLSTFATTTPHDLAQAVPDVSRWFQLYVLRGPRRHPRARRRGRRDTATRRWSSPSTCPISGRRERDLRSEVRSTRADLVPSAKLASGTGNLAPMDLVSLIDPNLTWGDIERLAGESELPVLVKGILSPEDALLAVEHGARAVVVSNHGGRQLDTVLSGADALAPIVDAVGDRVEVIVDGGIRRGTDVLKALALGARAVLVGRPVLWGLAVDGCDGAQHVLRILLDELRRGAGPRGGTDGRRPRPELRHPGAVGRPNTMKILVTGITGYVGSRLAPRLARDGHEVRGFARRPETVELELRVHAGDAVVGRRARCGARRRRRRLLPDPLDGARQQRLLRRARADRGRELRPRRACSGGETDRLPRRSAAGAGTGIDSPGQPPRRSRRSCAARRRARSRSEPRS